MKRKLMITFIIGLMLTGTAQAARYDFGPCQPFMEMLRTFAKMKVNDTQKRAIATILKRHKSEFETALTAFKNDRENLKNAIWMKNSNHKVVKSAYEKLASSGERILLLTVKVFREIDKILTPEQRRILREGKERINKAIACRMQSRRVFVNQWVQLYAQ